MILVPEFGPITAFLFLGIMIYFIRHTFWPNPEKDNFSNFLFWVTSPAWIVAILYMIC